MVGAANICRDHCFIQDFPFYGSRRVNLPSAIMTFGWHPYLCLSRLLTPMGRQLVAGVKPLVMSILQDCASPTNNQTYDRIYFLLRSPEHFGQHCANYINMGMDVVAPLLDYYSAMVAIANVPRRRFFYGWHRRILTDTNPRLAALPNSGRLFSLQQFFAHASRCRMVRPHATPATAEQDEPALPRPILPRTRRRRFRRGRAGLHRAAARLATLPLELRAVAGSRHHRSRCPEFQPCPIFMSAVF